MDLLQTVCEKSTTFFFVGHGPLEGSSNSGIMLIVRLYGLILRYLVERFSE